MRMLILLTILHLFSSECYAQLWGGQRIVIIGNARDSVSETTVQAVSEFVKQTTTGHFTGQTAANNSIATVTVGSSDASYTVSGNILITTNGSESFSLIVDYTDEGNTARSVKIPFLRIATSGYITETLSPSGAVPYPSLELHIRCKASTSITVKTSGDFTGCTYTVDARITRI